MATSWFKPDLGGLFRVSFCGGREEVNYPPFKTRKDYARNFKFGT